MHCLDRWTEVLGPSFLVSWIRMEGIPLHAWSEKVFRCIGECFGQVLEVDDDSVTKRRVDRARVKVLCDVHQAIHGTGTMEVGGVRF